MFRVDLIPFEGLLDNAEKSCVRASLRGWTEEEHLVPWLLNSWLSCVVTLGADRLPDSKKLNEDWIDDRQTPWARLQKEWFWVDRRMTEGVWKLWWLRYSMTCVGPGRRKQWGWSGGCQEEGRKANWQRKRYKVCLPDVWIPWGASAIKQHADSLLLLSDENNTSLWTTPTSAHAFHMQGNRLFKGSTLQVRGNDQGVLIVQIT